MKTLKKISRLLVFLAAVMLLVPAPPLKAQLKKMSARDLTNESTAIVVGKCIGKRSEWNDKHTQIYTYIDIAVDQYIKGNLGPTATLLVPGGKVGNIVYEVSEMPEFIEGEELVAFVWTNNSGKHLVSGGNQGKLKVETDPATGKKMIRIKNDEEGAGSELLDDFVTKVKGYMKH
jgi:hypothetical protein